MKPRKTQIERIERMTAFDLGYAASFGAVCGMDEAGRGPLAGPVCAACVRMPLEEKLIYLINDSKKISEAKRREADEQIRENAIAYGVGFASVKEIEEENILNATHLAMRRAYEAMNCTAYVMCDAVSPAVLQLAGQGIMKGDAKSYSIAAASILAKVSRDALMIQLEDKYPEYGFAKHKGYGTAEHMEAIRTHGPIPGIHRMSFLARVLNG